MSLPILCLLIFIDPLQAAWLHVEISTEMCSCRISQQPIMIEPCFNLSTTMCFHGLQIHEFRILPNMMLYCYTYHMAQYHMCFPLYVVWCSSRFKTCHISRVLRILNLAEDCATLLRWDSILSRNNSLAYHGGVVIFHVNPSFHHM